MTITRVNIYVVGLIFFSAIGSGHVVQAHADVVDTTAIPIISDSNGATTNLIDKTWDGTPPPTTAGSPNVFHDLRNGLPGAETVNEEAPDVRASAKTIIGANLLDTNGDAVATVQNVIVDQYGNPQKVLLVNNGVFGIAGKLVVLNFQDVIDNDRSSSSVMKPVSEDLIKQAAPYDGVQDSDHVQVSLLMGTAIKTDTGESLAQVENIVFDTQTEPYLILAYSQGPVSGIALVKYKDVQKTYSGDAVSLELTKAQSDFFKAAMLNKK